MKKFFEKYSFAIVISIITLIGAILRFYNASSISLSNDELSALSRLRFDNFSDLIDFGVKVDGHPAGVQILLYYWTQLFGTSVLSVRFPFIIAGIASISLLGIIAKKWFGEKTAIFAALTLAFLEYTIAYSQLARPYSIGLFFTLLNLYFWTKLFIDKRYDFKTSIFYAFSIAFAALSHYFSFLNVILIAFFGLLYLNKQNFKYYFSAIFVSIILYLPHLSILNAHLSIGGVGGWLGKPSPNWIILYLFNVINNSFLVLSFLPVILIVALFFYFKKVSFSKLQIISVLLFLFPFLIGYFYSVFVNPVLQYSVLLFSFPFLIIFFFSFFDKIPNKLFYILIVIYSFTLLYSTVLEKKYFTTEHFGNFKAVANSIEKWNKTFGKENVTNIVTVSEPFYIKYYLPQNKDSIHFEKYKIETDKDFIEFTKNVKSCKTKYFVYALTNSENYTQIVDYIKVFYPYVKERSIHFNSGAYIFSKINESNYSEKIVVDFKDNFEKQNFTDTNSNFISFNNNICFKFDKNIEYGQTTTYNLIDYKDKFSKIVIKLKCYSDIGDVAEIHQVVSIDNVDISKYWKAVKFDMYSDEPKKWFDVVQVFKIPENYIFEKNDILKIYTWNKEKKEFLIDDVNIKFINE